MAELELLSFLTLSETLVELAPAVPEQSQDQSQEQIQEPHQGCSIWVPKDQGTWVVLLSVLEGEDEAQHMRCPELGVVQLQLCLPWNQPHF